MAAQSTELEMEVWRNVFDQNRRKLRMYLIPEEIIDLDTGFELFSFIDRRDIMEETNTTKKNEDIIRKVRSKGEDAYKDFKIRLKITNQSKLADLLTYTERGLSTEEIEQQLDKMLEEQITQKRDQTMERKHKEIFLRYLPKFVDQVDPQQLLTYLPCLSKSSRDTVDTAQRSVSRSYAAQVLHSHLERRPEGFRQLVLALRHENVDCTELADLLDPQHCYDPSNEGIYHTW
ncbi:uncharacterized protein LOC132750550 [Ruditapes philippinarum]|uniref:uncharacterized protein LOC132750550 n=1 Tax=Ruditapes philippinarum TaxID=129788 RepID=UPI00295A7D7F|nr:uncharacterized protein LOC132750550 [Ruditapes philippinarum]